MVHTTGNDAVSPQNRNIRYSTISPKDSLSVCLNRGLLGKEIQVPSFLFYFFVCACMCVHQSRLCTRKVGVPFMSESFFFSVNVALEYHWIKLHSFEGKPASFLGALPSVTGSKDKD